MGWVAGELVAGRYRLDRQLGEGGMGVVWSATHAHTGRRVALKFLKVEGLAGSDVVQRFLREARAATVVKHPNVVEVLDVFLLDDGIPVMVLDLLEGETLRDRLVNRGRLSLDEFLRIMLPVLQAVEAAHAKAVVHRDLKPENIFLARNEVGAESVKVLDFGIAKLAEAGQKAGDSGMLTESGVLLGTPAYMAPEQLFADRTVDHRADLWSLGVISYELLTGERPIAAENVPQLIRMILSDSVRPLSDALPNAPPAISQAIMHLLTREPGARASDTLELAEALQSTAIQMGAATLSVEPSSVRTPPRTRVAINTATPEAVTQLGVSSAAAAPRARRWRIALPAAILGLVAVVLFGLRSKLASTPQSVQPSSPASAPSPFRDAPPAQRRLVGVRGVSTGLAALAPDGKKFAYGTENRLMMRAIDGSSEARALPLPPVEISSLQYSPDGKRLVATEPHGAWVLELAHLAWSKRFEGEGVWNAAVGNDTFLVSDRTGVKNVSDAPDGIVIESSGPAVLPISVTLSPSERYIALARVIRSARDADAELLIRTRDGRSSHLIASNGRLVLDGGLVLVLWPTERRLLYGLRSATADEPGTELWQQELDENARPIGSAQLRHRWLGAAAAAEGCTAAADRCLIALTRHKYDAYVGRFGSAGSTLAVERLPIASGNVLLADFTSDHELVFFSDREGNYDIFGTRNQLASSEVLVSSAAWEVFPQLRGKSLLYWELHPRGDGFESKGNWMRRTLGETQSERLLEAEIETSQRNYVPPRHATFRCPRKKLRQCVLRTVSKDYERFAWFDIDSRTLSPPFFTGPFVSRLSWDVSPNGEHLVVAFNDSLKVVSARDGSAREVVVRTPRSYKLQCPTWAHDGNKVYATALTADTRYGIIWIDPTNGESGELWRSDDVWPAYPVVSDDGKRLGFTGQRYDTEHWVIDGL